MTNQDNFRPTIVCLCGSTRFKDDFEKVAREQTLKGRIVLTLAFFSQADGTPLSQEQIKLLAQLHRHKMKLADEIFIINRDGYIGDSTRDEIEFAKRKGKFIEYLEIVKKKITD